MNAYEKLTKWDRESKIEKMDLEQIKAMLCPISYGNPLKCVGCKSVNGCPAGQRVNVLLEQETQSERKPGNPDQRTIEARKRARAAVDSGDPLKWISEHSDCNYKAARQKLINWKRKYPDIMEGIELSNRSETMHENNVARGHLKEALESGNPYAWYQKNCKIPRIRAEKIIKNGLAKHPELKELLKEPKEEEMQDEMSINDFLETVETPDNGAEFDEEQASEELEGEIPFEPERPVETQKQAVFGQTVIKLELEKKYENLLEEKDRIMEEIRKLENRLAWLEEQQDAIVKVKNLFDPSTAIGK